MAKKPIYKRWWFWVIVTVVVIIAFASQGEDESNPDGNQGEHEVAGTEQGTDGRYEELTIEEITVLKKHYKDFTANDTLVLDGIIKKGENLSPEEYETYYENIVRLDEEMEAFEDEHTSEPDPKPESEPEPVGETKKDVPKEYQSALNKAYIYSDTMYMSKAGLYDQLVSEHGENFSKEAAQYAVDNVIADWKENALNKAILYQNSMSMSPNAIYDQLISKHGEGFTKEEAQYAVDNLPE